MATMKTSQSSPLRIDSVLVPEAGGEIGMTLCPGKVQQGALCGDWRRDLDTDLAVIASWGARAIVSLMEPAEYERFQVSELPKRIPGGIEHHDLPIPDAGIPSAVWEERWQGAGPKLRAWLRGGQRILIHCRGGLGRTGTVAAKLLVELGMPPQEAIAAIRAARPGAIETPSQEQYVLRQKALSGAKDSSVAPGAATAPAPSSDAARAAAAPVAPGAAASAPLRPHYRLDPGLVSLFRGCLLGGAVGDALGAPIEFLSLAQIREAYGSQGLCGPADAYGRVGAITDDTQMTLFTAEGLLRAHVRGAERGTCSYAGAVNHAYLRWLHTQGEKPRFSLEQLDGHLLGHAALFQRRAPGNTCLAALRARDAVEDTSTARNDSKGCGGVMRVAPVGLYLRTAGVSDREVFELGCAMAALTHGHLTGQHPAGALAVMIRALVKGRSLEEAVRRARAEIEAVPRSRETLDALDGAVRLAAGTAAPEACIRELGEGWIAEEALAIAVFCALRARDLEHGVLMAVNIDGDSDSTGAIVGNLLGAERGVHEIPESWLESLELRTLITEVADDLCSAGKWNLGAQLPAERAAERAYWLARYPGW